MIRDFETAKRCLGILEAADKHLTASLELVRANCSPEEYKEYRSGLAHVTGRLFFLLMEPLYCEHPSLAPADAPDEFKKAWASFNREKK